MLSLSLDCTVVAYGMWSDLIMTTPFLISRYSSSHSFSAWFETMLPTATWDCRTHCALPILCLSISLTLGLGDSLGWGPGCIYDPKCEYWPGIAKNPFCLTPVTGRRATDIVSLWRVASHWLHHSQRLTHFLICYLILPSSKKLFHNFQ